LKIPLIAEDRLKKILDILFSNFNENSIDIELINFLRNLQFNPFNASWISDYMYFMMTHEKISKSGKNLRIIPKEIIVTYYSDIKKINELEQQVRLAQTRASLYISNILERNISLPLFLLCDFCIVEGLMPIKVIKFIRKYFLEKTRIHY
jgi:hypothetical protein